MPTMASVVRNRSGRFEIRESYSTRKGPRSRTLATFAELDDAVLANAESVAERPFDRAAVIDSARRAGARVALPPAEKAARELLTALNRGAQIPPGLASALRSLLPAGPRLNPETSAAAAWSGVGDAERGEALAELLDLADAIPTRPRDAEIDFPRLAGRA